MDNDNTNDNIVLFLNKTDNEKSCDFVTSFKRTLYLQRPMECALVQLNLPQLSSSKYIREKLVATLHFVFIDLKLKGAPTINENNSFNGKMERVKEYDLNLQTYFTIDDLINKLNDIKIDANKIAREIFLEKYEDPKIFTNPELWANFYFSYKTGNKRFAYSPGIVRIDVQPVILDINNDPPPTFLTTAAYFYINFNNALHNILGFDKNTFPVVRFDGIDKISHSPGIIINTEELMPYTDEYPKTIAIGSFYNVIEVKPPDIIFVYCDIVKETFVGNVKANILKIFPINTSDSHKIVSYSFDDKVYIPLRIEEIHSILISIRNNSENKLYYKEGDISATLLIRPIEYI